MYRHAFAFNFKYVWNAYKIVQKGYLTLFKHE